MGPKTKSFRPSMLNVLPSVVLGIAVIFVGFTIMQMAISAGSNFGYPRISLFGVWVLRLSVASAAIHITSNLLSTMCTEYLVNAERIEVIAGIFTKRRGLLELYRIKDLEVIQPAYLRPFKTGHLLIVSSDKLSPILMIRSIKQVDDLADWLKSAIAMERKAKGVRELD